MVESKAGLITEAIKEKEEELLYLRPLGRACGGISDCLKRELGFNGNGNGYGSEGYGNNTTTSFGYSSSFERNGVNSNITPSRTMNLSDGTQRKNAILNRSGPKSGPDVALSEPESLNYYHPLILEDKNQPADVRATTALSTLLGPCSSSLRELCPQLLDILALLRESALEVFRKATIDEKDLHKCKIELETLQSALSNAQNQLRDHTTNTGTTSKGHR